MATEDDKYQITEADIDRMLEYLRIHNPKQATPEIAVKLLERLYIRQHMLEHFDPDAIEEELKDLEEY